MGSFPPGGKRFCPPLSPWFDIAIAQREVSMGNHEPQCSSGNGLISGRSIKNANFDEKCVFFLCACLHLLSSLQKLFCGKPGNASVVEVNGLIISNLGGGCDVHVFASNL